MARAALMTMADEGLLELLQSATGARPVDRSKDVASSPLQSTLLASLLTSKDDAPHPSILKRPPPASSGSPVASKASQGEQGAAATANRDASFQVEREGVDGDARTFYSIQEMDKGAIKHEVTCISQVKNSSAPPATGCGILIAVTRHCIAYVLNDRKLRLIAQDNAATGIMALHTPESIPIVDIAWSTQELEDDGQSSGLQNHSRPSLLASISVGGEVCIGMVYAESSTTIAYEAISTTSLPQLNPATGLAWNGMVDGSDALLAVYGAGQEIFLISGDNEARTASLKLEIITPIQSVSFGHQGSQLYIAGLDKIAVFAIQSIGDAVHTKTISLPPRVKRVWLIGHGSGGVIAVAILGDDRLWIQPFFADHTETTLDIGLLSANAVDIFASFDQSSNILCLGSRTSTRLVCIKMSNLSEPVVAVGQWPNSQGAVSVFCTSQLHEMFSKSRSGGASPGRREHLGDADLFMYAYHVDSVTMYRLTVDWESTKPATGPKHLLLPSASQVPGNLHLSGAPQAASPIALAVSSSALSEDGGDEKGRARGVCASVDTFVIDRSPSAPALPSMASQKLAAPKVQSLGAEKKVAVDAEITAGIVAALGKQLSEQNKQMRRDRREYEIAEQQRQQELLSGTIQGIQQAVISNLHSVVQKEMNIILEERLLNSMDTSFNRIEQRTATLFDGSLSKALLGKPESVAASISQKIVPELLQGLDKSVKASIETRLLPGLQAMMGDMLEQLTASLSKTAIDASKEHYKKMSHETAELRKSVEALQQHVLHIPNAHEFAQTVTNELRNSFSPSSSALSLGHRVPVEDDPMKKLFERLEVMISQDGDSFGALVKVLEIGDIAALNWILSKVDPTAVLDAPEMSLPVMLSLAQQLGCELSTKTEEKLAWLAEVFTIFDGRTVDPSLEETIPSVLDDLFSNLRVLFAETAPSSPTQKQLKTVMRLVRLAMS